MVTRVRPSIRRAVRILLPILIVIGAWQVWDNIETRRLEAAFSRIRPVLDERAGNRLAGAQESAERFYAAAAIAAVLEDRATLPQDSLPALVVRMRGALQGAAAAPAGDVSRSDAVLARNDLTLQLVDRGARLPFEAFSPGTEFNYRWSGTWTAERLATLATLDALRKGNAAAAARSLVSRLKLLRTMAADSLVLGVMSSDALINQSTDLALLLALPGTSEADLQPLHESFADVIDDDELRRLIAGFAESRYDFVNTVSGARSWQYGHLGVPLRPLLSHRVVTTLLTSADALEIAKRPWPERLAGMKSLRDRSSIVRNVFLPYPWWQVAEPVQQATRAIARGVAAAHVARVALAANAYRRGSGRPPATVPELGLDREATLDPFSGQPLIYRPTEGGFVVYSVGDNGRDDGGALDVQPTRGAMPGTGQRLDVGVRVTYAKPLR